MGSVWLSLGSLFLGILCTSSSPTLNGNEPWIFIQSVIGSLTRQPSEYSVQPIEIPEPQDLDSPIKQLYNKPESNVVGCGSYSLDEGQTVTIKSRNSGGKYPANEDCRWNFQTTFDKSKLTISCGLIKLRGCKNSSLRITGGGQSKRICRRRPKLSKTVGNTMRIYFRTSSSKMRRKGFSCTVSASVPCKPCGTVNRVTRIIGGVETEVNEYPWQAAIVRAGTNDVVCGGSLLNDAFVLTAASCIYKFKGGPSMEVLLGAHDLDNPTEAQLRLSPVYVDYFPEYDNITGHYDVGLIFFLTPIILSDRVKPICLPDIAKDYSGYNAVTSGWGSLSEGGSQTSTLNEVVVPILANDACSARYPSSNITSIMICAGYPEGTKDRCEGDTGGPLVVEDNGLWVLVGITSWGNGCGKPYSPGVYSRVTPYFPILSDIVANFGGNHICNITSN